MKLIDAFNRFCDYHIYENAPVFFITREIDTSGSSLNHFMTIRGCHGDVIEILREAFQNEAIANLVRQALPPAEQKEIIIEPANEEGGAQ